MQHVGFYMLLAFIRFISAAPQNHLSNISYLLLIDALTKTETGEEMAEGKYRLSINGFACIAETWDDTLNWDGNHDEVYFRVNTKVMTKDGTRVANSDAASLIMGDVRGFVGRLQVGSASDWLGSKTGGIISGDSFPTPTPWMRNVDLDQKRLADPRAFPPYSIWEGTLKEGDENVVFVTPTIWEWDPGQGALDGWANWQVATDAQFGKQAKDIFGDIWPVSKPVFDAVSLGIQTFGTLPGLWSPAGKSMQRPIGLTKDPNDPNGSTFNTVTIVLTYELAEYLFTNDLSGLGNGRIGIHYQDDPYLRGDYYIYLELDKLGAGPRFPDGSVVRETSRPEVYVIFGGAKFWIPDPATLARLYGGWAAVEVVPDGTLEKEGIGDHPVDNTLLKEEHDPHVWRMENNQKCWVVSPSVLSKYGGWAVVRIVPNGALQKFSQGPNVAS
jgi:hypothetical protein